MIMSWRIRWAVVCMYCHDPESSRTAEVALRSMWKIHVVGRGLMPWHWRLIHQCASAHMLQDRSSKHKTQLLQPFTHFSIYKSLPLPRHDSTVSSSVPCLCQRTRQTGYQLPLLRRRARISHQRDHRRRIHRLPLDLSRRVTLRAPHLLLISV